MASTYIQWEDLERQKERAHSLSVWGLGVGEEKKKKREAFHIFVKIK